MSVTLGCSQSHLQLNTFRPLIISNVLHSIRLLSDGMNGFREHCALGLKANKPRCDKMMQDSLMNVTVLTAHIGYQKAA